MLVCRIIIFIIIRISYFRSSLHYGNITPGLWFNPESYGWITSNASPCLLTLTTLLPASNEHWRLAMEEGVRNATAGDQVDNDPDLVLIQVRIPDLHAEKCLQFSKEERVWDVKQQILAVMPKVGKTAIYCLWLRLLISWSSFINCTLLFCLVSFLC